jgi:hypothetical protein
MDFISRNRFLVAAIVLLLVVNAGALLLLFRGKPVREAPAQGATAPDRDQQRIVQLLGDELGFDSLQISQYKALRKEHQERKRMLNDRMRELKTRMFEDVLRDHPAPALSDSLLLLTHQTQDEIERLTFAHLLDVKRLCKEEQRSKLRAIIRELFRSKPQNGSDVRSMDDKAPPRGGASRRP